MTEEEQQLIDKTIKMSDEEFKEFAKTISASQLARLYKLSTESLKDTFKYIKDKKKTNDLQINSYK